MDAVGVTQTIFCPAFPRAGRTVYRGHLFVGDKLLNESGMENHPLNPMTDANLVRFLSKQVSGKVGLLAHDTINQGAAQIGVALATLANDGIAHVVADTCNDSQLDSLAEAAAAMPLVTGGSGLARYLPRVYRTAGIVGPHNFVPELPKVTGRSAVIAGSCSKATHAQVQWMRAKCPIWIVDVAALIADASAEREKLAAWASATETTQPLLVASTALPDQVTELQSQFGVDAVASAIEEFLSSVALWLTDELNVRRLILAGGETSGAITNSLGVKALHIGPEICTGVPWTETIGRQPQLALALKSGNFRRRRLLHHGIGDVGMSERDLRERITMHGKSIFDRGLTAGSSGNLSVQLPDGMLITPTNSCLGRLDPDRIAKLDRNGNLVAGDKPSKEAFLHHSMYQSRPDEQAIVHLHSTHSVAVSCLAKMDESDVLPPITAYYVMRIGKLPLVPYFAPR